MDITEKIAVLKLAGFELRHSFDDDFDWIHDERNRCMRDYTKTETQVWESAWAYINGDADQEYTSEPWSKP